MHSPRPQILVLLGFTILALGAFLRQITERGGHATDASDFGLGVLAGIGLALLLLGTWRATRNRRHTPIQ